MKKLVAFTALCVAMVQAWGMAFTPLEMNLVNSGRGSSGVYRLMNTTSDPVSVDMSVYKRGMDKSGADKLELSNDDFIVVPAQATVMPGQTQSVRVQYVGSANIQREQSYRLVAEQVPVEIPGQEEKNAGIKVLLRYVTSLYVTPPKSKSAPQLMGVEWTPEQKDEKSTLKIVIRNTGTAHHIFRETELGFQDGERAYKFLAADLTGLETENVLAETERVFTVKGLKGPKTKQEIPVGNVKIKWN